MMQVDGPALATIREALGLTGAGAQITEYPDGIVEQVLDIAPLIRRGRTTNQSSGLFSAIMANVHAGAGTLDLAIDPYNFVPNARSGWPQPVPPGFDVWLLRAGAFQLAAAAVVDAMLYVAYPELQVAYGAYATYGSAQVIQAYNTAALGAVTVYGTSYLRALGTGVIGNRIQTRLPRGSTLGWQSNAGGIGTAAMFLVLGLFPAGLGQDGEGG